MNEQREVEKTIDTLERELVMLERDRQEFKNELQEAVSLLGRGASMYFEYEVKDAEGIALTEEVLMVKTGQFNEIESMNLNE